MRLLWNIVTFFVGLLILAFAGYGIYNFIDWAQNHEDTNAKTELIIEK